MSTPYYTMPTISCLHNIQSGGTDFPMEVDSNSRPSRSASSKGLPTRYQVNYAAMAIEGGLGTLFGCVLDGEAKLEVSLTHDEFPSFTSDIIEHETAHINAALTEPIDDPDARDPQNLNEAKSSLYWAHWLGAIYEEMESLHAKGVYEDIDKLPPGRKAVGSKWVLHIKRDKDGLIASFKARLVAKGFTQIPGQDFTYTFAPTARWESIRTLLTLAARTTGNFGR